MAEQAFSLFTLPPLHLELSSQDVPFHMHTEVLHGTKRSMYGREGEGSACSRNSRSFFRPCFDTDIAPSMMTWGEAEAEVG
jgi:hypothetical protein